jgi:hypothetical protein
MRHGRCRAREKRDFVQEQLLEIRLYSYAWFLLRRLAFRTLPAASAANLSERAVVSWTRVDH